MKSIFFLLIILILMLLFYSFLDLDVIKETGSITYLPIEIKTSTKGKITYITDKKYLKNGEVIFSLNDSLLLQEINETEKLLGIIKEEINLETSCLLYMTHFKYDENVLLNTNSLIHNRLLAISNDLNNERLEIIKLFSEYRLIAKKQTVCKEYLESMSFDDNFYQIAINFNDKIINSYEVIIELSQNLSQLKYDLIEMNKLVEISAEPLTEKTKLEIAIQETQQKIEIAKKRHIYLINQYLQELEEDALLTEMEVRKKVVSNNELLEFNVDDVKKYLLYINKIIAFQKNIDQLENNMIETEIKLLNLNELKENYVFKAPISGYIDLQDDCREGNFLDNNEVVGYIYSKKIDDVIISIDVNLRTLENINRSKDVIIICEIGEEKFRLNGVIISSSEIAINNNGNIMVQLMIRPLLENISSKIPVDNLIEGKLVDIYFERKMSNFLDLLL